ncbi:MAG: hypothetical protein P8J87_09945, partial [Verrucomicrobiales bacterium]|nr:hypothetical protein [Verrucomicrobiales bacterium]
MKPRAEERPSRPPKPLSTLKVALAFLVAGLGIGIWLEKDIGTSSLADNFLARFDNGTAGTGYPVNVISVSKLPDPHTSPYKN